MRKRGAWWWLALTVFASCAAAPASQEEAIVGGAYESGYDGVYLLAQVGGGACTATLITPHVVLTARHCVITGDGSVAAPTALRLYVGSMYPSFRAEHSVARVETIPGSTGVPGDGADLALLVLDEPASEMPYPIARESDGNALLGVTSTALGFGLTPAGTMGNKIRASGSVVAYSAMYGLIRMDVLCEGDSGGPLLGPDGLLYGVASFVEGAMPPVCGMSQGYYNEVARHLGWIDSVLAAAGDLCLPAPEVCDGLDNNCDAVIDEGCLPLGSTCATSSECTGGLCADTSAGRLCTAACDPTRPELGCGATDHCAATACEGFCVPGPLGTASVGSPCAADADCSTGYCRDPGDGARRCLPFCRVDAGACLAGEVCAPFAGACGGCVDASIVAGPHGWGERCASDAECRSLDCFVVGGLGECASACVGGSCDTGVCVEDHCVRDRRQAVGGPCMAASDCASGSCVSTSEGRFCSIACATDATCPSGTRCDPRLMVCAPELGLDASACTEDADCFSMRCEANRCVSSCGPESVCPSSYECRRDGGLCVHPASGCSANPRRGSIWPGLVSLAFIGAALRKRRA